MAAESLENIGKEIGHSIKVETQGQTGTKNKLTKEEIENAKAIIIASDIKIDLNLRYMFNIININIPIYLRKVESKKKELKKSKRKDFRKNNKISIKQYKCNTCSRITTQIILSK